MALTATNTDTMANYLVSTGTLSGADDAFTFDINMSRFWISTPAAVVSMYLASQSSGKSPINFPVNAITEMRLYGLGNRAVTLKGTATQVITIIQEVKDARN